MEFYFMSGVLSLPAPAKLNLFLYITGRRDDGYHNLQTLFIFLDYSDRLDFELQDEDRISVLPAIPGVPETSNLIYRAAESLLPYRRKKSGIRVNLIKNLPMGGGIGGGSSDAATTLAAVNRLWECDLSVEDLAGIGKKLGADVPVFVRGRAAFAEGIGEKLVPVELQEKWYLVVVPDVHVSTKEIFCHPDLARDSPVRTWDELKFVKWSNDCQSLVKKIYPPVDQALVWLLKYAPSRMTGTGACVFGEFDERQAADEALQHLPDGWKAFVARGLNQSPLYRELNNLL